MSTIDTKQSWQDIIKSNKLFPHKIVSSKTIEVSCPTRFNKYGKFSIQFSVSFYESEITFEMLLFNDNVILNEIDDNKSKPIEDLLVKYELSNRLSDRYSIDSSDFKNVNDFNLALIDFINNKATENGRMFDDKLDELNASSRRNDEQFSTLEKCRHTILSKVNEILAKNYKWHILKNESLTDTTVPFYDKDNKLVAVVSLYDDCLFIDLSRDMTAKISLLQSDTEIKDEIITDIDNAKSLDAATELSNLNDIIANNHKTESYRKLLENRITRLENLYINSLLQK